MVKIGGKAVTIGDAETVISKVTRDAAGLTVWPDGTFGVTKSGADYTFYASNSLLKVARTVGTLANPLATSTSAAINISGLKVAFEYAAGGPVYDAGNGLLLMFYHAERHPGGDAAKFYSSIGMAKSTNGGAAWTDLGEIIKPNISYPQAFAVEVGGGGFIVKDGYFYVYFNDYGAAEVPFCVARAAVADVVAAAATTDATTFYKWTSSGQFDGNGLTALGRSLVVGQSEFLAATHIDVAYNAHAKRYIAAYVGPTSGLNVWLAESVDGLTWTNPFPAIATMGVEEFYPSLIGTGDDPTELGSSFYVYYTSSVTGGASRWNDAFLARRLITLADVSVPEDVSVTRAAPSGAVFAGGAAYNSVGALHVSDSAPAAGDPRMGGIARKTTGEIYVSTAAPSGDIYIGGVRATADGRVYVSDQGAVAARPNGLPVTSSGQLVVNSYGTSARVFDGTSYATRGATLTGASDGKQGTLAFGFRIDGGNGTFRCAIASTTTVAGGTLRFAAYLDNNNLLVIVANNAAGANILTIATSQSLVASSRWRRAAASWNLASAGARHIYIDDLPDCHEYTFTNDTIDYTVADWGVGAVPDGTLKWHGALDEFIFHTTYLDLSVEANRRKLDRATGGPANVGSDGSTPLGAQPLIYLPNGDPSANAGSGGNLVNVGSLTASETVSSGVPRTVWL